MSLTLDTNDNRISFVSFTDECYRRILTDILTNTIRWGERLDIAALAESYGVSRSPVVKAIERLAHEGLVEIVPNKGSFVRTPTKKDIIEVSELRIAVESMNVELAYRKNKAELLAKMAELDQVIAEFEQRHQEIPENIFLDYDRDYHWTIAIYADNSRLLDTLDKIRNQVDLFRIRTYSPVKSAQSIARHREVVRCLEDDRLDAAICALRKHIYEVCEFAIETVVVEAAPRAR